MANQQLAFAIRAINEASAQLKAVQGDIDALGKSADAANPHVDKAGKSTRDLGDAAMSSHGPLGKLSSAFGDMAKIAGGFVIGQGLMKVPGLLNGAMSAASDLSESLSKVGVVFGESAPAVESWANTAAKAMGMSKQQALEAAGTFGNFLQAMGQTPSAAKDMSLSMVQLASDLASFNNADPSEVLLALRSGLSGESEPLRKFGVALSEAAVQAKAAEMGLGGLGRELTEQEKISARYAIIMAQTTTAQGDFARTSGGAANQQRILAAETANLSAEIGTKLLPAKIALQRVLVEQVLPALSEGVSAFGRVYDVVSEKVGPKLAEFAAMVQEAMPRVGEKIRELAAWFQSDVQPKIEAFVEWVKPKLEEFGQKIQEKFADFQAYYESDLKPALENIRKGFEEVVQWVVDHWDQISKVVTPVIDEVKNNVETAFNAVRDIFKIVIDLINGDWSKAWHDLKALVSDVVDGMKNSVGNAFDLIKGAISGTMDAIKSLVESAWGGIVDAIESGAGWIGHWLDVAGGYFNDFANMALSPIQWVIDKIGALIDKIKSIPSIGDITGGIGDAVGGWIPGHAAGTLSAPGGLSLVGEQGPELVMMPRGARVWNTNETRQMLAGSPTVNISVNGPVYANSEAGAGAFFGDMGHAMVSRLRAMGAA